MPSRCCCGTPSSPAFSVSGSQNGLTADTIQVVKDGTTYYVATICPAIAAELADGQTIVVNDDGTLTAIGAAPSCKDTMACVTANLTAPLTGTDGLIGVDITALAGQLADGTTIKEQDGKLTVNPQPLDCADMFGTCNLQPVITAEPGSGLTITQPADPTTGQAVVGVNGETLISDVVLPNFDLLLSGCAAGASGPGCAPNPLVLDAEGKLAAPVPTTVSAGPGVAVTGSPATGYTVATQLSGEPGNLAHIGLDGGLLVLTPPPVVTPITTEDSASIDLTGDGSATPVKADLILSGFAGQRAEIRPDGLYVPPISIADTNTLDLSGQGSAANPLLGNVKISGNPGQTLGSDGDGLYHPGTQVFAGSGVVVTGNAVSGWTVSAAAPVSPPIVGRRFIIEKVYTQPLSELVSDVNFSGATPDIVGPFTWNNTTTITVTDGGLYSITANVVSAATLGIGDRACFLKLGAATPIRLSDESELVAGKTWASSPNWTGVLAAGTTVRLAVSKPVTLSNVDWSARLSIVRLA